jgi:uncharacterized protein with GYD domain
MVRYIVLFNWTDQGVKNAKDTVQRVHDASAALEPMGVRIESIYWTEGEYDLVAVMTAAEESSVLAGMLKIGGAGNVRTRLARAYDEHEVTRIVQKLG